MNRSIPIEVQLLLAVFRKGLDRPDFVRVTIDAANFSSLCFRVKVRAVGWVFKDPEAITTEHIFPARVGNAAWIGRVSLPRTVVLQSAIDVIGIVVVSAHVVELRSRQIEKVFPSGSSVFAAPEASVISGDDNIGVAGVDPNIV